MGRMVLLLKNSRRPILPSRGRALRRDGGVRPKVHSNKSPLTGRGERLRGRDGRRANSVCVVLLRKKKKKSDRRHR